MSKVLTTSQARKTLAAIRTLDNMAEIARTEGALMSGLYCTPAETKLPPLCQGVNACAIGSLYLGAGVQVDQTTWTLPHTIYQRGFVEGQELLQPPLGLKEAYDALDVVSRAYMTEHGMNQEESAFENGVEILFEYHDERPETLIDRIEEAKALLFESAGI